MRRIDGVAVGVEQLVELGERGLAVAQQKRQARAPQGAATEPAGLGRDGRQRILVVVGRTSAAVVGHDGPQRVAQFVELVEQVATPLDPFGDRAIAPVELDEQLVAPDVELLTPPEPQAGVHARVVEPLGASAPVDRPAVGIVGRHRPEPPIGGRTPSGAGTALAARGGLRRGRLVGAVIPAIWTITQFGHGRT